jgi:hypothetical protein
MMKLFIPYAVRKLAAIMVVSGYNGDQLQNILLSLTDFIKTAPDDYFESISLQKKSFREIPLYLSEKGESHLKEKLSEYHDLLKVGDFGKEPGFKGVQKPNLLYLIGKFLTMIALRISTKEVQSPDKFKEYKKDIEKLYAIWGSREEMSEGGLFNHFGSKKNDAVKGELMKKMSTSAEIMERIRDILN